MWLITLVGYFFYFIISTTTTVLLTDIMAVSSFPTRLVSCYTYDVSTYSVISDRVSDSSHHTYYVVQHANAMLKKG